jgi:MFS transporter, DHA2 family, multidrug resistance protein
VMDTGMLMAPRGFGVLTSMIVVNRLMAKVDGRMLLTTGYVIAAYSLWMMTRWSLDMGRDQIILAGYVQGLGLGLIFVPCNMIAFSTLPPRFRPDGTTLMTLFRNIGSSFGISVIVTTLARNLQISHSDIAANVTSFNVPAVDPASTGAIFGDIGATGLAMLDGAVNRQAAMIAYLDNFYMLFWVILAFAPLSWLVKRPQLPGMSQPAAAH